METSMLILECGGRHPSLSFFPVCRWVMTWMPSWTQAPIAFATVSVPRLIYFPYSMTLTLNVWSCTFLVGVSAVALHYWIRWRFCNSYSQLGEQPLVKPDINALHPDMNMAEHPPAFDQDLDRFSQAVKIFGFLEKPVFHELATHLQTRQLVAGDSILLDQDRNFYCVIDGTVQVFAKADHTTQNDSWDDEEMDGYHLINRVGGGGTLSSLFSILSLFTDQVKLSWQEDAPPLQLTIPVKSDRRIVADTLESEKLPPPTLSPHQIVLISSPTSPSRTRGSVRAATGPTESHSLVNGNALQCSGSPHICHGIIGRATEDTTLAVIPAQAFRTVTKKFPKATGHIVQVILTRFSRVTFNVARNYLGMTTEVLRTEKAINEIACHPLPDSFYEGGGLRSLHHRFDDVEVQASDSENGHLNHEPSAVGGTSSISPRERLAESPTTTVPETPALARSSTLRKHHQVQAGDLLTSAGQGADWYRSHTRTFSVSNTPHTPGFRNASSTDCLAADEFNLRDEVMACIAKSIGLLQPPPLSRIPSSVGSPVSRPVDASSQSPPRLSPFESLSLLDTEEGSISSMAESASSTSSATGYMRGLDNEVEILFFSAGSTFVKTGERNTGLYYVIEGLLDILLPTETHGPVPLASQSKPMSSDPESTSTHDQTKAKQETRKLLFTVKPGGIAGYLASLCSIPSYVDIQAKSDTYVGFLSAKALERLLEKRPIVQLTLAKRLISLLSPAVLQIDAALDWMQVHAGQILWRPQDFSDSFYIVINGRLRTITEGENGKVTITGEYGQGATVGELDVIANSPRRTTMHAIRDSELIRMPQTLFNAISSHNPRAAAQLLRTIASRVRSEMDASSNMHRPNTATEPGQNNTNLKTVAILPISRHVPIDTFARKLQAALEEIGAKTSYLNQASVSGHLGWHAFSRMGKLKTAAWLADQEERYRMVLYVADSPVNSPWTHTCIRQADFVLIVGMGDDPSIGEYERLLLSMKTTARKDLVLLHPERSVTPGSTREWLKNRPWVHQHTHVELPGLAVPIAKTSLPPDPQGGGVLFGLKRRVHSGNQQSRGVCTNARPQPQPLTNDFARLARKLCGKSVGVVLGGGGARGLSHIGVIRALEERGIPIDYIAGTSIGAFIGGLYAHYNDLMYCSSRTKQFCRRMGNYWSIISDLTYPLVAYTTGHDFNRKIYEAFYDLHIEDMWLPFFCNTTNLNTSCMDIHDTGYAWRFIRASMTLAGMLPPLCDNGSMLVDGGYLDNLPVTTMLSMGASVVFAADPGAIDDNSPRNYGDSVSGWWLLFSRWSPFTPKTVNIPAIPEIQGRLTYTTSVRTLEEAKVTRGVLYMGMPVLDYGLLDFYKFDELEKKGYSAAREFIDRWDEQGKMPILTVDGPNADKGKTARKGRSARRNSI